MLFSIHGISLQCHLLPNWITKLPAERATEGKEGGEKRERENRLTCSLRLSEVLPFLPDLLLSSSSASGDSPDEYIIIISVVIYIMIVIPTHSHYYLLYHLQQQHENERYLDRNLFDCVSYLLQRC